MKKNFLAISILLSAIFISGAIMLSADKMTLEEFDENLKGFQSREESRELNNDKTKEVLKIEKNDRVLGDRDSEVSIFEYSDFECPFCKRFYESTNKAVEDFDGKVNLVYRHFPGLHQPLSIVEANAVECAGELGGDEIFYKYHDELYKRTNSNGKSLIFSENVDIDGKQYGLNILELTKIASELNLNLDEFNKCSASMKFEFKISKNMQSGSEIGVTGTPNAFVVNNKTGEIRKINGALPYEILKEKIEEVL